MRSPLGSLLCAVVLVTTAGACSGSPVETPKPRPLPATPSVLPSTSPTPTPATTHSSVAPTVTPTVRPPSCSPAAVLTGWSTQRLAEQTVTVPVDEGNVGAIASEVAAGAGGVILFGSVAPTNLAASLAAVTRLAPGGIAPFVMTDEEGGAIQRMANLVGALPSAREMAETMSPSQIKDLAYRVGLKLRAAGVTMDLAPVLDLDAGVGPNNRNPDGTRSFSLDESIAASDGLAFARGLAAAGIVPVVKHFPGLGQATGNTDVTPASTLPWNTLQGAGLLPFASAARAGLPAVMVANASVPGLTPLPASISPTVITQVLKQGLGFNGLVLTDALSAVALSKAGYSVPRASVLALRAGADMVLFNAKASDVPALTASTVQAIVAAVDSGELSRARLVDAVLHILTAKRVSLCR